MVDLAPFRALRYDPAVAGDAASTSAPAYDELEALAYASHRVASPYTVLELIAAGAAGDYDTAGATYRRWRRTGVLRLDPVPALYRYEEHELRGGVPAVQRGLLGALALEPLDAGGAVLPHEHVDPARVAARRRRLRAVPADLAPVFTVATALPSEVSALLATPPAAAPLLACSDEAGIDHRVWALDDPDAIAAVRRALRDVRVVLADGHHRYAAALAARGSAPASQRTLVYLCDATVDGPRLAPVHRLVTGLGRDVVERLAADFAITPAAPDDLVARVARAGPGTLGLRLRGGRAWTLVARDPEALATDLPAQRSPRWRRLDSALLELAVLPRLGVRPDAVSHHADATAAAAQVEQGRAALFVLAPVDVATVVALAEGGERMPPKTTSFRPKPRTGLVMRALDDGDGPWGP